MHCFYDPGIFDDFITHARTTFQSREPVRRVPAELLRGKSMTLDRLLHEIIPYRMNAVSALNLATRLQTEADKPKAMEIYIDGKLRIEGNLFAFTNPVIEAGL